MRISGLDEAQEQIKNTGRNINNLRYADDTTLMEKSEEELKSLLMKMKEESEKAGLKYNIRGEQDGRGVGGCGVHLFKCMKNTSREQTGVLDQQKRIYRTMQNLVEQKN